MVFEILSPLHIGSGNKLLKGLDFIIQDNSLFYIEKELLFNELAKNNCSENYFSEYKNRDFNFSQFCRRHKIEETSITYPGNVKNTRFITEIQEFMRSGDNMGSLIIPGSSIKGALRSHIIKYYFHQLKPGLKDDFIKNLQGNSAKKQFASGNLVDKLLIPDINIPSKEFSNYNILRALKCPDIYLTESELKINRSKILSLSNPNGDSFHWKERNNREIEIYSEILRGKYKMDFALFKIDETLFSKSNKFRNLKFDRSIFDNLVNIINNFSKEYISSEISFLEKCGKDDLQSVITFYKNLLKKINNNDSMIFRMSAGSGWKSMTGNLISDNNDFMKKVRNKYEDDKDRFGKKGFPVFPKSRRLIINEKGEAVYPMGWIRVFINNNDPEALIDEPDSNEDYLNEQTESSSISPLDIKPATKEDIEKKLKHLMRK